MITRLPIRTFVSGEFEFVGLHYNDNNLVVRSLPSCHLCVVVEKAITGHYFDPLAEKNLAIKLFRDTYDFDLLRNPESVYLEKRYLS